MRKINGIICLRFHFTEIIFSEEAVQTSLKPVKITWKAPKTLDEGILKSIMVHLSLNEGILKSGMVHLSLNGAIQKTVMLLLTLNDAIQKPVMVHLSLDNSIQKSIRVHLSVDEGILKTGTCGGEVCPADPALKGATQKCSAAVHALPPLG